MTMFLTFYLR